MQHYPAQHPYPYAQPYPAQPQMVHPHMAPPHMAPPHMAPPYMAPPAYAMPPAYPPPYAPAPYAQPQPQPYPQAPAYPAGLDAIEQRLRAYQATDTAVRPAPGNDERLLKVIDAAVRSTENKTAAAIDALATLIEKQRKSDADASAATRQAQAVQAAHAAHAAEAQATAERTTASEVTQVLSTLTERLTDLEKSVASAHTARGEEALAQARQIETRIGEALAALQPQARTAEPERTVTFEAANDTTEQVDELPAAANGVRPPPRNVRPRITVPRSSFAVSEIAARQRLLDAGLDPETRTSPETAALDAIRRSIAALADQVRETARDRAERKSETPELRADLKALQRSVEELAPRQIVATVNESIRELARKIEQSREDGVRESQLAPIEALLGEMRANMMELREPRGLKAINESLALMARRIEAVGERSPESSQLDDMQRELAAIRTVIADVRREQPLDDINNQMRALGEKLDLAAERPRDTRAMLVLAEAVEDVRNSVRKLDPDAVFSRIEARLANIEGLGSRIDALADRLSAKGEVQVVPAGLEGLTERIEQMTVALGRRTPEPDFSPILERIEAVQQSIERAPKPSNDVRSLEGILRRLADRIEDVRQPGAEPEAFGALQSQMSSLAERLDRATPSHPALGGLERTLSELCQKVASLEDTASRASPVGDSGMDSLAAEGMMLIKRDLTEMKTAQSQAESRSQEVLRQVNTSLEALVGRLAAIEADMAKPRPVMAAPQMAAPQPMMQAAPKIAPQVAPSVTPAAMVAAAAAAAQNAAGAIEGRPAPVLARPVEPRVQMPASRPQAPHAEGRPATPQVASAEADLDLPIDPGNTPATAAARGDEPAGDARATFIAAARRAAQAAQAQTAEAMAEIEDKKAGAGSRLGDLKALAAGGRKPILLGLAAVLVALGGLSVANRVFEQDAPRIGNASDVPALSAPATQAPQDQAADTSGQQAQTPDQVAINGQANAAPAQSPAGIGAQQITAPQITAPQMGAPTLGVPPMSAQQVTTQQGTAPQAVAQQPAPQKMASAPVSSADAQGEAASMIKTLNFSPPEKLKQAALTGNPSAAYEIGARLAEARNGASRDVKAAAQWIQLAADQGMPLAQYRLGSFHREGLGVPKDNKAAFALFNKAAESGNILAMHNLAVLHAEGINGAADYAAAAQWFRNAAEHGVKDSQFNIAVLYQQGLGVKQDPVEAYKWYAAAARQGDPDAGKRRDAVFARIPAEKQEEARQAAENFRAKRPDSRANDIVVPEGGWEGKRLPTIAKQKSV